MSLRKAQNGVMLLEALIAILIFSLGILGLVGMQASAVRASRDAQFRSEAGLLANELIGEMRTDNRDGTALVNNFASAQTCPSTPSPTDTPFCQWSNRVATVLPGVGAGLAAGQLAQTGVGQDAGQFMMAGKGSRREHEGV